MERDELTFPHMGPMDRGSVQYSCADCGYLI